MSYTFQHPDPNVILMYELEERLKKEYKKNRESFTFQLIERDLATLYKLISWVYSERREAA